MKACAPLRREGQVRSRLNFRRGGEKGGGGGRGKGFKAATTSFTQFLPQRIRVATRGGERKGEKGLRIPKGEEGGGWGGVIGPGIKTYTCFEKRKKEERERGGKKGVWRVNPPATNPFICQPTNVHKGTAGEKKKKRERKEREKKARGFVPESTPHTTPLIFSHFPRFRCGWLPGRKKKRKKREKRKGVSERGR